MKPGARAARTLYHWRRPCEDDGIAHTLRPRSGGTAQRRLSRFGRLCGWQPRGSRHDLISLQPVLHGLHALAQQTACRGASAGHSWEGAVGRQQSAILAPVDRGRRRAICWQRALLVIGRGDRVRAVFEACCRPSKLVRSCLVRPRSQPSREGRHCWPNVATTRTLPGAQAPYVVMWESVSTLP